MYVGSGCVCGAALKVVFEISPLVAKLKSGATKTKSKTNLHSSALELGDSAALASS